MDAHLHQTEQIASELLKLVQQLSEELHPGLRGTQSVTLDSSLDRDLGFDSLGRMELLRRIEAHFHVSLSEAVFTDADTARDLLCAIVAASPVVKFVATERPIALAPVKPGAVPSNISTLTDVLAWHLVEHPDRPHIYFYSEHADTDPLSYRQLYAGAIKVAAGLQRRELAPGAPVAIMQPSSAEYFFCFFGVLLAGGVPVPIYPPTRKSQMEDHLWRQRVILENCAASLLITMPEALLFSRLLKASLPELRELLTVEDLSSSPEKAFIAPVLQGGDTAFLQYTSGSTGNPKGVVLTHANLLANIRAMGAAVQVDDSDIVVSWLPLYHDMGLIGCWLSCLYYATPMVLLSPFDFLSRPARWLHAIHRYRATLSAAPNFAYEICLTRLSDAQLDGLDLSSWRCAFNGAEAVSANCVERFVDRFKTYGFRREALMPVYGMAENSVGLAFPPLERGPLIDVIDREIFTRSGEAVTAIAEALNPLRIVACGQPLAEHEIRVVDSRSRELQECREGRVQFRGPSASSGYYRSPEKTASLFDGDWLNTGDLGYVRGGDIYITGRSKDLIIIAGRNIYPQELEEAVAELQGVRKGNVVVFGTVDQQSGTERLVVLAETRATDLQILERLRAEINDLSLDLIAQSPHEIILAEPQTVPKTSSGKIRRSATRELYEQGLLGVRFNPWQQYCHLALIGVKGQLIRTKLSMAQIGFAVWSWVVFSALAPLVYLSLLLLPKFSWRWSTMRLAVNGLRYTTGTLVTVHGVDNLPEGPCVVVANHASYLDGYVLVATLPRCLIFVAKQELAESALLRLPFQRINAEFVDRFDKQKGVADARRLGQRAGEGHSLMFFPEGTFSRQPGLQEFHMGAFVAATEANLPVVPIAIRGTRSVLRGRDKFPRRGAISVHVGEPIFASDGGEQSSWEKSLELRELSRKYILHHCGEPDLVRQR